MKKRSEAFNQIDKLVGMKLHEVYKPANFGEEAGIFLSVVRVPGGWIYNMNTYQSDIITSTYVPEPGLEPRLPNYEGQKD